MRERSAMSDVENAEEILTRLMPRAMGAEATRLIEETIDRMAAEDFPEPVRRICFRKWAVPGGIAATLVLGTVFFLQFRPANGVAPAIADRPLPRDIVLLNSSNRVETISDEGWQEQQDGSTMHAVRMDVVDENEVRDRRTGIVMRVSQPREEWILTPVTSF